MILPLVSLLQRDAVLLQATDRALDDATRRAGSHLVCRPGCTQCCFGAFAINPLDALRLRNGLESLQQTVPERAAAIRTRAEGYIARYGEDFPGDPTTGILNTSPEAQAAFENFANDAACPVLDPATGWCELYDARPMTCRTFGPPVRSMPEAASQAEPEEGLAVCELCFTQATPEEIAAAEMIVPHKQEQGLLNALTESPAEAPGDTIIAYCLTLPPSVPRVLS